MRDGGATGSFDNRRVSSDAFDPAPSPARSRRLSCGIVVLTPAREVLLCHVTGQRHWDLPKGGIHTGETPRQAALRETVEETSLVFDADALADLGRFEYTAKKDLHLFAVVTEPVDPQSLSCGSHFLERGSTRMLPEMDGFGWFAFSRVAELCTARMAEVLQRHVDLDAILGTGSGAHPDRLAA